MTDEDKASIRLLVLQLPPADWQFMGIFPDMSREEAEVRMQCWIADALALQRAVLQEAV